MGTDGEKGKMGWGSLGRLGPELISLVIDKFKIGENQNHSYRYLARGYTLELCNYYRLSQYATISRAWQHEVERRCFRSLDLYSAEDLAILSRLLSRCPGRRAYLSHINLSRLPKSMTPGRWSLHPLTFRADVAALLAVLHRCMPTPDVGVYRLDEVDFAWDHLPAFPEWTLLEDPSPEPLPSSRRVRELVIENHGVHPIAVAQFATAMPQLEVLWFAYYDPAIGRHKEQRDALVRSLNSLSGKLPRLKELNIRRAEDHCVSNHSLACQSLADDEGVDLVNEAVRKLARPTVEKLCLRNWLLSEDLLLNRRRDASAAANNTWPKLCDLELSNGVMAPNGKWYVTGQPSDVPSDPHQYPDTVAVMADMDIKAGMGTEPQGVGSARENGADLDHRWRQHIDDSTLSPLLETLAEAVTKHMPQLREVKFLVGGRYQDDNHGPQEPSLAVLYDERFADELKLWELERRGTFQQWDIPQSLRDAWKYSSDGQGVTVTDVGLRPGMEVEEVVAAANPSEGEEEEADAGDNDASSSEFEMEMD
ncbi:hypothetical protein PG996_006520 [Apiospora saccharicola]|uniref:F-box domain-containing protein n=1 Tax=Apiospora saccharicola TaxID=335842 RepID=A0ABR1V887_9PEZI